MASFAEQPLPDVGALDGVYTLQGTFPKDRGIQAKDRNAKGIGEIWKEDFIRSDLCCAEARIDGRLVQARTLVEDLYKFFSRTPDCSLVLPKAHPLLFTYVHPMIFTPVPRTPETASAPQSHTEYIPRLGKSFCCRYILHRFRVVVGGERCEGRPREGSVESAAHLILVLWKNAASGKKTQLPPLSGPSCWHERIRSRLGKRSHLLGTAWLWLDALLLGRS